MSKQQYPQSNREMLDAINKTFKEHSEANAVALELHQQDDTKQFKLLEEKMNTLATKEDIKEMKEAFEDCTKAGAFVRIGGIWGYRTLLVFATIMVSIVAIGGGFKTILSWFRI